MEARRFISDADWLIAVDSGASTAVAKGHVPGSAPCANYADAPSVVGECLR